jgi:hypothetical protein
MEQHGQTRTQGDVAEPPLIVTRCRAYDHLVSFPNQESSYFSKEEQDFLVARSDINFRGVRLRREIYITKTDACV